MFAELGWAAGPVDDVIDSDKVPDDTGALQVGVSVVLNSTATVGTVVAVRIPDPPRQELPEV